MILTRLINLGGNPEYSLKTKVFPKFSLVITGNNISSNYNLISEFINRRNKKFSQNKQTHMIWNSDHPIWEGKLKKTVFNSGPICLSNFHYWFTHREVFSWKRIRAQRKDGVTSRMLWGTVSWGLLNQLRTIWSPREAENKFWPELSLWMLSAPCWHLLRNKSSCVALGFTTWTTASTLRSHLLCSSCWVCCSFYLVFQIARKNFQLPQSLVALLSC